MLSIMPPAPLVDMPLMLLAPLGGYASACMGMDQYIVTPAAGSRSRHDLLQMLPRVGWAPTGRRAAFSTYS